MSTKTIERIGVPIFDSLPSLDLGTFISGADLQRKEFADALLNSFLNTGFVKLKNHGIPDTAIRDSFAWSHRFHNLSYEAKKKTKNIPGPKPQRGWSSLGDENTAQLNGSQKDQTTRPFQDAKEHYDIGATDDTQFPNQWPDKADLPGFCSFMQDYYVRMQTTSLQVIRALELGLGLSGGALEQRCEAGASELRLNYYPAISFQRLQQGDTARIWPHTDFGIITLLFQNGTGGLEIEDRTRSDAWMPVMTSSTSELVVNISDTLERWTNGVLKAGLHRVSTPPGPKEDEEGFLKERWSVAYFLKARREVSVGPLPQFVEAGRPAAYRDITALQYQKQRTSLVYTSA